MRYAIQYELTVCHESTELDVNDVDEALALVREVIGDHIVVDKVGKDRDGSFWVGYEETISHEAVVSGDSEDLARDKLLMVNPDADITDSWKITEDSEEVLDDDSSLGLEVLNECPKDGKVILTEEERDRCSIHIDEESDENDQGVREPVHPCPSTQLVGARKLEDEEELVETTK